VIFRCLEFVERRKERDDAAVLINSVQRHWILDTSRISEEEFFYILGSAESGMLR
jgi:hypothetical protein